MEEEKFKWHLETRNLKELVAYEKNARFLSEKAHMLLSDSISRFGMAEKPIVNLDNTIIGGHQRVNLLLEYGETECECWIPDHLLSAEEMQDYNILLNKAVGDWEHDILANLYEIDDLFRLGFDEDDLGLEKPEKKKKLVKPTITFEFSDKEIMLSYMQQCEELAEQSAAKMKVKG